MKKIIFIILGFTFFSSLQALQATELSLRQLEQIALKKSGLHPEEVLRWKKRARWSALLPRVVAGYEQKGVVQINNSIQDSISVTSSSVSIGPPDSSLHQEEDFNRFFSVKAYWDLNELIFNHDELAVSAEARSRKLVTTQIIDELHQAYFERKKILSQHPDKKRDEFPASLQLRLEELEAKLDNLTDGEFLKSLENEKETL
ncbi:MAG: hypothetical protein HQM15_03750 [Deltaproteobacteria bacterium]|nr:hypothetical protein [Deltaproteobacteria bacterium]